MSERHLSVIVPAYDEEKRLPRTLARLHEYYSEAPYAFDVTVVSDGSQDNTGRIVEEFAALHPQFRLIEYHPNRGKGCAVRTGMLQAKGDLILFCDADLATPQEETQKLLERIDLGADIAIGSRPLRDSRLEKRQPIVREMLGRASNKVIQVMGIAGIRDTQCGFKIYRHAVAQNVFRRCKLDGFSFDFESLMIARDLGYRIDEVPIRWSHQEGSKVSFLRDYPRAFRDLVQLRIKGKSGRTAFREEFRSESVRSGS